MENPLIILTHPLPEEWIKPYRDRIEFVFGPEHHPGLDQSLKPFFENAKGIVALLCDPITRDHIQQFPNLKVISNMAAGTDNIDLAECKDKGIKVGNTPGVLTNATADLTMAIILCITRNIVSAAEDARAGRWQMWEPASWLGMDLNGKTLGIYGMGKIGKAVATRARCFGMDIIYHNRTEILQKDLGFIASFVSFEELLKKSDVLSIHAPLNTDSRGKFDKKAFSQMKNGSILVNVGRGQIIDTDALVYALKNNIIRAAGLDVTDPEPLPVGHPLYDLKNCLVLPHIGSATDETRKKMVDMAMENILAGLEEHPLPYPV